MVLVSRGDGVAAVTLTVTLPWPDKALSPNARVHWAKKHKVTNSAKEIAWYAARGFERSIAVAKKAQASVTFHPPDKRKRDLDNMLASCKAYFDGIATATGCDDSKWDISIKRAEPIKGGRVVVELSVVE